MRVTMRHYHVTFRSHLMRLALLALAGLVVAAAPPRVELKVGDIVSDIGFKAYDGKEYKLSDFRANAEKKTEGQVVVVYFQSEACTFTPSLPSFQGSTTFLMTSGSMSKGQASDWK